MVDLPRRFQAFASREEYASQNGDKVKISLGSYQWK